MVFRTDLKLCVLWMLLMVQVLLVVYYLVMAPATNDYSPITSHSGSAYPIRFLAAETTSAIKTTETSDKSISHQQVTLKDDSIEKYFVLVNVTLCFTRGTDTEYMKRFPRRYTASCACLNGWHGRDCGQPEVVWRAFMASRQKIVPTRRTQPRRIIHGFPVTGLETSLSEMKLLELAGVVDLFVVCESNLTKPGRTHFRPASKMLQGKILYVVSSGGTPLVDLWRRTRATVRNLRDDDLLVLMGADQIPNARALLFLKLYDGWPEPVSFRLRWSVYGFFWQHPSLTTTALGARSVGLVDTGFLMGAATPGLVVGDLNHYGGWHCSWCLDPRGVIEMLGETSQAPVDWSSVNKVDVGYVEDLIGSGLWLDGRTALLRRSPQSDRYFAPETVLNNSWRFDSLHTNYYTKFDYD